MEKEKTPIVSSATGGSPRHRRIPLEEIERGYLTD